jgi:hypothetical protein
MYQEVQKQQCEDTGVEEDEEEVDEEEEDLYGGEEEEDEPEEGEVCFAEKEAYLKQQ